MYVNQITRQKCAVICMQESALCNRYSLHWLFWSEHTVYTDIHYSDSILSQNFWHHVLFVQKSQITDLICCTSVL